MYPTRPGAKPLFGCIALLACAPFLTAQNTQSEVHGVSAGSLPPLIGEAVRYQTQDFHHTTWGLHYRVHVTDAKGDSTRELVESRDGNVARTLQRQGQRLTAEEDTAEQQRLRSLTPSDLVKRHNNSGSSDKYGIEMITALPIAMTYTLTPGQPQLQQFPSAQIVVDYVPNPAYHPSTASQSLLASLAGRMWIDAETHHLLRIEINIMKNLNLAMGLLARVYQGGSMTYEQRAVGGGHYAYSHIDINVRLREFMVKTIPFHSILDATEISVLPKLPSLKEAVELLLSSEPADHP